MDTSSPFVDPYPNRSSVDSIGLIAVTSVGDSAAEASSSLLFESDSTNSDESDIILASSRPKKKAGRKEVQGDEAPGVQRSEEEEYRQVGLRGEGAEQEDKNMAGDLPHRGDGGACSRRGSPGAQGPFGVPELCRLSVAAAGAGFHGFQ
ncbi:C-repeat/DRE binding factor 2 [Actinidia rufa]|uniref:C-repeat/DRE binding factor 2 n=1 Tax=Actinidia rufa TaxID=165716 RepID=A0A7J0FCZ4_9ERIC|nr:C-repeat/DRE binding factor 2 [Actinidia rufa]